MALPTASVLRPSPQKCGDGPALANRLKSEPVANRHKIAPVAGSPHQPPTAGFHCSSPPPSCDDHYPATITIGRPQLSPWNLAMSTVTVYSFFLGDIRDDQPRPTKGKATRETIESLHGVILEETAEVVDESLLNDSGRYHHPKPDHDRDA
jgi:hypothetical protein